MTQAPYESLFLLPKAICKSCGSELLPEVEACQKCGEIFPWALREELAYAAILVYTSSEALKENSARILDDLKSRKWCKFHGFQKTFPLEKDGVVYTLCIPCVVNSMAPPSKRTFSGDSITVEPVSLRFENHLIPKV